MKKVWAILIVVALLSTLMPMSLVHADTTAQPGKNIIEYFPEWRLYDQDGNAYRMSMVPWSKITALNYAFGVINGGLLSIYDTDVAPTHFADMRTYKARYPNVKTLISVGGWTRSESFHYVASTDAARTTFANSAVSFIRTHGFDGVDIDWEYPCVQRPASGQYDKGNPAGPEDKHNFTLLLKSLRTALDAAGQADGKHYLLTIAAPADPDKIALQEPDQYHQYLDWINVMTYDYHGNWDSVTGHLSPLYHNPAEPSSFNPEWNTYDSMAVFTNTYNVPKSKLNVGAPFYSRGWGGVAPGPNGDGMFQPAAGPTPVGIWDSPSDGQGQNPLYYMKQLETTPGWQKYRDPVSLVPWLYNPASKLLYTYEDEQSVTARCDLVNNNGYAGMMVWEVSGDFPKAGGSTMLNIVYDKMLNPIVDTQAPTAPSNLISTGKTDASVSLSWTAATDDVGVTGYEVYSGGVLVKSVTGTTATVTGLSANTTYTFTVKAKDSAGNKSQASSAVSVTTEPPDTQAPTAPSNLISTGKTDASVSLSWTAATDNMGVAGYDVYKDSTLAASVTGTTATVAGLTGSTAYTFTVKAKDAAGNASPASNAVTVTTNAPDLTVKVEAESFGSKTGTSVAVGNITDSGAASQAITQCMPGDWTSYGVNFGSGTTSMKFRYANAYAPMTIDIRLGSPTGTLIGTANLPLTGGWSAYNTVSCNITNTSGAQNIYLVYGGYYPYLNWFSFTPGGQSEGDTQAPTAPANLVSTGKTDTTVSLSWTAATDNVGVTGYEVYKGSALAATVTGTTAAVTGLTANTAYTFTVKAKDAAGNVSAASNAVNVTTNASTDTQAPTVPANLVSTGKTDTTVSLSWTASTDNVGVTGYEVYKGSALAATVTGTTATVTGLTASTAYTFTVKAKDAAGNVSAASNAANVTTNGASVSTKIEAEAYTSRSSANVGNYGSYIGVRPNEWTSYADIDLTGKTSIDINYSNAYAASSIEIRVGSPAGTLIGTVSTPLTGTWSTYSTATASISSIGGVQTIYLIYTANNYDNINWFEIK